MTVSYDTYVESFESVEKILKPFNNVEIANNYKMPNARYRLGAYTWLTRIRKSDVRKEKN